MLLELVYSLLDSTLFFTLKVSVGEISEKTKLNSILSLAYKELCHTYLIISPIEIKNNNSTFSIAKGIIDVPMYQRIRIYVGTVP